MRKTMFVVPLVFFLFAATSGFGFDQHRKGFILGGLGGISIDFWKQGIDSTWSDNQTDVALHTDFRIGGGFKGDKFMLYYWNKVNWFGMENVLGEKVTVANGISGAGASYYLKPEAPSLYFNGGAGISTWRLPFESDTEAWWGMGLIGGVGFEFARHWSAELGVMWSNPGTEESGYEFETRLFAVTLSIIGMAY